MTQPPSITPDAPRPGAAPSNAPAPPNAPVPPNAARPDSSRQSATQHAGAQIVHLPDLEPVPCPCGLARRAFAAAPEFPGTVHLTEIHTDAKCHYHQHHTEVYVILECESDAAMELDGQLTPVRPHTSILIPPGVRHRARGKMKVLIICTPEFDSSDEHFDP